MNNNNLSMYDYLKLATCKNNRIVPGRAAKGNGKGKDEGKGKAKAKVRVSIKTGIVLTSLNYF
jgi:hypothetical protein